MTSSCLSTLAIHRIDGSCRPAPPRWAMSPPEVRVYSTVGQPNTIQSSLCSNKHKCKCTHSHNSYPCTVVTKRPEPQVCHGHTYIRLAYASALINIIHSIELHSSSSHKHTSRRHLCLTPKIWNRGTNSAVEKRSDNDQRTCILKSLFQTRLLVTFRSCRQKSAS